MTDAATTPGGEAIRDARDILAEQGVSPAVTSLALLVGRPLIVHSLERRKTVYGERWRLEATDETTGARHTIFSGHSALDRVWTALANSCPVRVTIVRHGNIYQLAP